MIAAIAPERLLRVEEVMGTVISLDMRAPWADATAVDAFFAWLRSVDTRFSTYRPDSLVSRVRRGELAIDETDADFREVLTMCDEVYRLSRGAFDIWRHSPAGLDPSGLVKGWSVDRGAQLLLNAGARNFCINAGGDVLAIGEPTRGAAWRVGIRHPEQPDRLVVVIAARDLAIATSGAYERGLHISNPATGAPPAGLLSITISGSRLAYADAYATAGFAMGLEALPWMAAIPGYEGMAVTGDRRVRQTDGFQRLRVS